MSKSKYRVRVWVGACGSLGVHEYANFMRQAKLDVVCEGTEHVYLDILAENAVEASWGVIEALQSTHGKDFGLRAKTLFKTLYS